MQPSEQTSNHGEQTQHYTTPTETILSPRMRVSRIWRQDTARAAREGGDDGRLWVSANSMKMSINRRYSMAQGSGDAFNIDLHDLWFLYYQASQNVSSDVSIQYRLVFELLQAQASGPLTRPGRAGSEPEVATTSDGIIWSDLPFFASDMTAYWMKGSRMSAAQRLNFTSFLAKVASIGKANDQLCGIALIVLRETLEMPRHIGKLDDQYEGSEDPNRSMDQLSLAALLPVANLWLFHAGTKIIQLCDKQWDNFPDEVGSIGDLLRDEDTLRSSEMSGGFSPSRCIFWLKRLKEVTEEARQNGDDALEEFVARVESSWILIVEETDSIVKREAVAAGAFDKASIIDTKLEI
ncbi:Fc.00g109400.m01.CDS01 [Cosmosporella sp. VM-42]